MLMLVPVVAGKRQKFSALAMACDRYIISDWAEAAVASAVLQDIGVIASMDLSSVYIKTKSDENESESVSSCKQAKTACFLGVFL